MGVPAADIFPIIRGYELLDLYKGLSSKPDIQVPSWITGLGPTYVKFTEQTLFSKATSDLILRSAAYLMPINSSAIQLSAGFDGDFFIQCLGCGFMLPRHIRSIPSDQLSESYTFLDVFVGAFMFVLMS